MADDDELEDGSLRPQQHHQHHQQQQPQPHPQQPLPAEATIEAPKPTRIKHLPISTDGDTASAEPKCSVWACCQVAGRANETLALETNCGAADWPSDNDNNINDASLGIVNRFCDCRADKRQQKRQCLSQWQARQPLEQLQQRRARASFTVTTPPLSAPQLGHCATQPGKSSAVAQVLVETRVELQASARDKCYNLANAARATTATPTTSLVTTATPAIKTTVVGARQTSNRQLASAGAPTPARVSCGKLRPQIALAAAARGAKRLEQSLRGAFSSPSNATIVSKLAGNSEHPPNRLTPKQLQLHRQHQHQHQQQTQRRDEQEPAAKQDKLNKQTLRRLRPTKRRLRAAWGQQSGDLPPTHPATDHNCNSTPLASDKSVVDLTLTAADSLAAVDSIGSSASASLTSASFARSSSGAALSSFCSASLVVQHHQSQHRRKSTAFSKMRGPAAPEQRQTKKRRERKEEGQQQEEQEDEEDEEEDEEEGQGEDEEQDEEAALANDGRVARLDRKEPPQEWPQKQQLPPPLKKRGHWEKNIEFLLAVIGFAVDLGNVWRFPYICYRNGGGAFLLVYIVMFIIGGLPIFYLEMSLGQYFASGCLTVWKRICPLAKGVGYAMCILNFFTGLYYNTVISWAVYFFVESFTLSELPWMKCNNSWNEPTCRTIAQRQSDRNQTNYGQLPTNPASQSYAANDSLRQEMLTSPAKEFFERQVLQIHLSSGIDDLGSIRWPLALYLALVFVFVYFAIWKGVKSTGKAVWITALLPYFVLIPLLIRGIFLDGAWIGIKYYLYPDWGKLREVTVWVDASKQIFFSLGPGFGTLLALSSYNKFHHNCLRDTLIAASVNFFASFIAGFVIFSVLGYMTTIENVDISHVATEGPGLVFQVYPEALATMRGSSLWSVLFFIMVITLGIDSTFGGLESVITGLCDEYPRVLRAHRGLFIGVLIAVIYLCSLPTTTYGGNYVINVLESYGTSLSLLFIVLIETVTVCWFYGTDKFSSKLEEMYGQRPGLYWRVCWKYISPTILLVIFVAALIQEADKYHTLTYDNYTYPTWALAIGWLMTASSVVCIPIYAIYMLTNTPGTFMERLRIATTPIEAATRGGDDDLASEYYVKRRAAETGKTAAAANADYVL